LVDLWGFDVDVSYQAVSPDYVDYEGPLKIFDTGHAWVKIEGCGSKNWNKEPLCKFVASSVAHEDIKELDVVTVGVNQPVGHVEWNVEKNSGTMDKADYTFTKSANADQQRAIETYITSSINKHPEESKVWEGVLKQICKDKQCAGEQLNSKGWRYGLDGVCTDFAREVFTEAQLPDPNQGSSIPDEGRAGSQGDGRSLRKFAQTLLGTDRANKILDGVNYVVSGEFAQEKGIASAISKVDNVLDKVEAGVNSVKASVDSFKEHVSDKVDSFKESVSNAWDSFWN
jgi:hypothetical protein